MVMTMVGAMRTMVCGHDDGRCVECGDGGGCDEDGGGW